ncbi:MAG: hypothetical protein WCF18_14990 [Chthoniobacteraceae bacterium]
MNQFFRVSAGAVCAVTGSAKVLSGMGHAGILTSIDPVFGWQIGHLMLAAGIVELAVAGVCLLCGKQPMFVGIFISWLATILLTYRLGLWLMDWHRPCHCLGNITDAIHVSPLAADISMEVVLTYLLIGSYGIILHEWWINQKVAVGRSEYKVESCR